MKVKNGRDAQRAGILTALSRRRGRIVGRVVLAIDNDRTGFWVLPAIVYHQSELVRMVSIGWLYWAFCIVWPRMKNIPPLQPDAGEA